MKKLVIFLAASVVMWLSPVASAHKYAVYQPTGYFNYHYHYGFYRKPSDYGVLWTAWFPFDDQYADKHYTHNKGFYQFNTNSKRYTLLNGRECLVKFDKHSHIGRIDPRGNCHISNVHIHGVYSEYKKGLEISPAINDE